jgi:hypothetical protein
MLLCSNRVRYVWSGVIYELSMGCMWHVGQVSPTRCNRFESPQLSDMSNRLSCVCHHVDNLMALMIVHDIIVILNYLFGTLA